VKQRKAGGIAVEVYEIPSLTTAYAICWRLARGYVITTLEDSRALQLVDSVIDNLKIVGANSPSPQLKLSGPLTVGDMTDPANREIYLLPDRRRHRHAAGCPLHPRARKRNRSVSANGGRRRRSDGDLPLWASGSPCRSAGVT
jgi:hypothetical protein